VSTSTLVLVPLIALSLVSAPLVAAAPDEDHCVRLQKSVDALDPNNDSLYAHRTIAQYQIHCLGTARPSALGQLVRPARLADRNAGADQPDHPARPDRPDHPDHPDHPDQSARP
jgi:hypothetical protein